MGSMNPILTLVIGFFGGALIVFIIFLIKNKATMKKASRFAFRTKRRIISFKTTS